MAAELATFAAAYAALARSRVIAVIGAHPDAARPAGYVPDYLHAHGFRVLPVNPRFAGNSSRWDAPFRETLAEIGEAVDLIDVFRRSELVGAHLADILAMSPRPKVVWLQQGVKDDALARELVAAGVDVVQDRCTAADHRHGTRAPAMGRT